MNIADVCIVVAVVALAALAWRRSATVQAGGFVGAILGVLMASLLYEKLAFLTQSSSIRTIVLVGILAGTIFLLADLFVMLARWLEKAKWRHFAETPINNILSSAVTALGVLFMTFVLTSAFANALPQVVQEQIKSSAIIDALAEHLPLPDSVSNLASLRQPFSSPEVFSGQEAIFNTNTSALGGTYTELDAATEKTKASMVKITVWGCGSVAIGSGFVVDPHHVMTNAHVVAGGDRISLANGSKILVGTVVWFDPKLDVAILRTQADLEGAPLPVSATAAKSGSIASHLGYTEQPGLNVSDVVVMQKLNATGYDIFRSGQVTREIYALRGEVIPGNSGGPVIDASGKVIGVIVGHSAVQSKTGYAIVSVQVADLVKKSPALVDPVSAGECIAS